MSRPSKTKTSQQSTHPPRLHSLFHAFRRLLDTKNGEYCVATERPGRQCLGAPLRACLSQKVCYRMAPPPQGRMPPVQIGGAHLPHGRAPWTRRPKRTSMATNGLCKNYLKAAPGVLEALQSMHAGFTANTGDLLGAKANAQAIPSMGATDPSIFQVQLSNERDAFRDLQPLATRASRRRRRARRCAAWTPAMAERVRFPQP